jgi:hypothetical protein
VRQALCNGFWTLASVTDHEGNTTERGERRAGAIVTFAGRPHPGLTFPYKYEDGSGYCTTSKVVSWELSERSRLVVMTKNSVYSFTKEVELSAGS